MKRKLRDMRAYEKVARRLSKILGHKVDPRRLKLFENPTGSVERPEEIAPGLTGYSGAFTDFEYDATFKLIVDGERNLESQRIRNEKSRRELVLETLMALVNLHDDHLNSGAYLSVGPNSLSSMNML